MDEKEILRIIEQAARDGRTELNLSYQDITSLPAEIGNLKNLTKLYLGGNQLTWLPAKISNLKNLTKLNLIENQLRSLPPKIINLKNLTTLNLANNQFDSLPAEIAKLENLTTLNLAHNKFNSLTVEIGNLKNLTRLDFSKNQIRLLPPEIGNLKNLNELYLYDNCLCSLPPEIGNLKNLTTLWLHINQLTTLTHEIRNLKNLTQLSLGFNRLSSLQPEIENLKNLNKLWMNNNKFTDISVLMGLKKLTLLDLRNNQIFELPQEIINLGIEIRWELGIEVNGIFLEGNPLGNPPIEIVKQGKEAVRNYFESIEKEKVSRVYEAKLLIVGEGGVGKTCLMKRLMEPDKAIDEKELTTEGIEINQWMIETKKAKDFRVNFWDFGGQEIYHATHQFFLTKRSLYLFVWVARTDDDLTSFDYWLNVVKMLSDNSPVIVVLNKIDERIKAIDEQSLQSKFENVKVFNRVSALQGSGIEVLTGDIKQQINQLPHIGDVLSTAWVDIRKQLEGLDEKFISFDEYKEICREFGLDEEKAEFLSQYYHDLGVFLHFLDNPVLREIVFLKPDWATSAVYKVVDTREIQKSDGKFHFEQLKGIWRDYPEDKFAHLLELMKKFELCFQIPKTQTYIVPELLRPGKPEFEWNYADNLLFEYRYEFMPAGIITRFIVRTHDICKEEIYWKNGVILTREKNEALIVSDRLHRKISLWIRGKEKKELLAIIRREIDYIHKTLNYPEVREMIPCICSQCARAEKPYFYDYETLCRFRAKGKIACEKSTEDVSIEKLLGEYERPEDKREMERRWREEDIHIEVNQRIEVSPTIEQKQVIEQRPPVESTKKRKWYKTWKVIWAIIAGIFLILGGIWTAIQIYEHFHN